MRRAIYALVPWVASCGLLMDFEPGSGEGGASGTGVSSSSPVSGSSTATDATSASTDKGPSSSSTSTGKGGGASSSAGGDGGDGGGGGGGGSGPTARWSVRIGADGAQILRTIAVSDAGRVAVAGEFTGTMTVGGTILTAGPGMTGTFVAAISPTGAIDWARKLTEYDPNAIEREHDDIDVAYSDETLIVTGSFDQEVKLDELPVPNLGYPNIFAAAYDLEGDLMWGSTYGDSDDLQAGGAVAVRRFDGHVFMAGQYCGNITFGDCDPLPSIGCGTRLDVWLAELDTAGECVRSTSVGSDTSLKVADDIAVDANGRLALIGRFDGTLDFGGSTTPLVAAEPPNDESYVALLGNTFGGLQAVRLQGFGFASVLFDEVDGFRFAGTMQLPVLDTGDPSGGTYDFVAGYIPSDGPARVTSIFGGDTNDGGFLVLAPDGTLHAYGYFSGDADFDIEAPLTADGVDGFATTLDDGAPALGHVDTFGGPGNQSVGGAGFDELGQEVIAGTFEQTTTVDGVTFVSMGATDIFVVAR